VTKKNEQMAARSCFRDGSWLSRLWRDQRGNGELFGVCLCGAIAIGGGLTLKDELVPKLVSATESVGTNLAASVRVLQGTGEGAVQTVTSRLADASTVQPTPETFPGKQPARDDPAKTPHPDLEEEFRRKIEEKKKQTINPTPSPGGRSPSRGGGGGGFKAPNPGCNRHLPGGYFDCWRGPVY
jgi:hypothetical protein